MTIFNPEYKARVVDVEKPAQETKIIRFRLVEAGDPPFQFTAGQFISVIIEERVLRAYTVASSPEELPCFEICIKIIPGGKASTLFDKLVIGDSITFRGPFGVFTIRDPKKSKLFIATGTGIAPMKTFTDELLLGKISGKNELIFGVRSLGYAIYHEAFRQLSQTRNDFEFTLCLSQDPEKQEEHFSGRVTDYIASRPPEYFLEKDIYLCGAPEMVADVIRIITEEKNCPRESIITEAY